MGIVAFIFLASGGAETRDSRECCGISDLRSRIWQDNEGMDFRL